MLAAVSTTGDWIVGGIALVVGLGIIVGVVWLLWRLVTWPARVRRRRRSGGGLGGDYEQMIRQQQRDQPRSGRREPFPPPGGWQPLPQPSRVVMPPPGYRHRETELPEPEPQPPLLAAETNGTPPTSGWQRLMRRTVRVPAWLLLPMAWLGLWYIVIELPFGTGWSGYAASLLVAVGLGVWTKKRYHSRVLWRGERGEGVVWVRWGKADPAAEPPVVVAPVAEALTDSTQTPTQTQPGTPAR
jgi:hypothetical protein